VSHVRWLAPSPLWDDLVGKPAGFRAPALLRFAGDDFIPQYQAALAEKPRQLRGFVARPETWREPSAGIDATPKPSQGPLRLYQPVHGRFYLVAASLACRVPGLPEHTVDVARGEVVAFVLRRLTVTVNPKTKAETETGEWAWVARPDGSTGWVRATGAALAVDEEQLPMFGTTFSDGGVLKRRLFAGLVPASRREAYSNGREIQAVVPPPAPGSLDDPRVIEFQRTVLDPWTEMKSWYDRERYDTKRRASALDSVERTSSLILLDFHDFLRDQLTPVWKVIKGTAQPGSLVAAHRALYDALVRAHATDRTPANRAALTEALTHAADFRDFIERQAFPIGGYVPRVLIGDPQLYVNTPPPPKPAGGLSPTPEEAELKDLMDRLPAPGETPDVGIRKLKKLVMSALAVSSAAKPVLPEQLPSRAPSTAGEDWFVVRCVYLRPHCGKKSPPLVSERSERFRLTSFFEPDAPARHLRVALPVDTSPATLRKYNRNVAFMLSDQLRKQMSRAASLKGLMDGEVGKEEGGLDFAVICSFSIPIITICALILLMIIVSLLNIIFWWLPFFRICFPVPRMK
jgi:hypothetical protein